MTTRISQLEMFAHIARVAAKRSSCKRLQVGCIIANHDLTSVVSIGYNGNYRGGPNECDRLEAGNCGCVHSEVNALVKAPYDQGALIMFCTHAPCVSCAKLILNSRVSHVYYIEDYRIAEGRNLLCKEGILVERIELAN